MGNEYWTKMLHELRGSVIERAVSDHDGEYFGIQIKTPLGIKKVIWFLMDEEGNGPGAFDITPVWETKNG